MAATDTLRALGVERLLLERRDDIQTITTSEAYPSRDRLYHIGDLT